MREFPPLNAISDPFERITLTVFSALNAFKRGAVVALTVWVFCSPSLHGHGAYHDVVHELEAKIESDPQDGLLHFQLAEAHVGHEEWMSALVELDTVERLEAGVHPVGHLRGLALHLGGKHEAARKVLDEFLLRHPDHADAFAARSDVLMALGRREDAGRDAREVITRAPSPGPQAYERLAGILQDTGDSAEAIKVLGEGLARVGPAPALLHKVLALETATGKWTSALSRIDALQSSAPSPEPWMAERAGLLSKAGRDTESRAAWTALRDRLLSLPNLVRGTSQNSQLLRQSREALGETAPAPVIAPPAKP